MTLEEGVILLLALAAVVTLFLGLAQALEGRPERRIPERGDRVAVAPRPGRAAPQVPVRETAASRRSEPSPGIEPALPVSEAHDPIASPTGEIARERAPTGNASAEGLEAAAGEGQRLAGQREGEAAPR